MKLPAPKWDLGSQLYQKIDTESAGILTGLVIRANSTISYIISWKDEEREHWEFELTDERTYGESPET